MKVSFELRKEKGYFVPTAAQGVQQTYQGGKFCTLLYCVHTLIRFPAPHNF